MLHQKFKYFYNRYLQPKVSKQRVRSLNDDEVALARSVFGDYIVLDDVRLKTAWWVLEHYAVSPNGHIYFHPADWIEDFSIASISKQGWLIHELTHVWQLQQGLNVVRGALFNRRYEYVLQPGQSFFEYGIEQQARMVQNYFIRRQHGQNCRDLEACIPFLMVQSADNTKDSDSTFTI